MIPIIYKIKKLSDWLDVTTVNNINKTRDGQKLMILRIKMSHDALQSPSIEMIHMITENKKVPNLKVTKSGR